MKYTQPYGISDPDAPYVNGNPSTGTMGSIPPAESIEHPQRELHHFIEDSRLTPNASDLHQLGKGIQSNGVVYSDDQGTLNQLVITLNPPVTQLIKGMVFLIITPRTNTGPTTLKVNSLPPYPVVRATDQQPLDLGDISPNCLLAYGWDGAKFQMVWSQRQPGAPIFMTAPRVYYVNGTTGDDSYDGQTATVGNGHGPYRTIQKACDQIPLYNMNNHPMTIYVADGNYNYFIVHKINGTGSIAVYGNTSNPAAVNVTGTQHCAIYVYAVGRCYIGGFRMTTTGPALPGDTVDGIAVQEGGTRCWLDDMEWGPCAGNHIALWAGAYLASGKAFANWKISGSANCFLNISGQCLMATNGLGLINLTITVPITYSYAFISVSYNSSAALGFNVINGKANVTGTRYVATGNSTINCGGSETYYPGTVNGSVTLGGVYG